MSSWDAMTRVSIISIPYFTVWDSEVGDADPGSSILNLRLLGNVAQPERVARVFFGSDADG